MTKKFRRNSLAQPYTSLRFLEILQDIDSCSILSSAKLEKKKIEHIKTTRYKHLAFFFLANFNLAFPILRSKY